MSEIRFLPQGRQNLSSAAFDGYLECVANIYFLTQGMCEYNVYSVCDKTMANSGCQIYGQQKGIQHII
jgi:hypothetical protein